MVNDNIKYCLIISQYYHSRHHFIVNVANMGNDEFLKKARSLMCLIEQYKRDAESLELEAPIYLGDLEEKYCPNVDGTIRTDINVNDAGDVYFRLRKYANRCMYEAMEFYATSIRESKSYKKKEVLQAIQNHHDYEHIKSIVESVFDIE